MNLAAKSAYTDLSMHVKEQSIGVLEQEKVLAFNEYERQEFNTSERMATGEAMATGEQYQKEHTESYMDSVRKSNKFMQGGDDRPQPEDQEL